MIRLFNQISNFFYWGWKLKENYEWDYFFLYEIIYLKLQRMEKLFCNGMGEDSIKYAKQIMVAKNLAKRLMDDKYDFYLSEFYRKNGEARAMFINENGITKLEFIHPKIPDYDTNEGIARQRDDAKREEDKKELFKLLEKQIEYWWE